MNIGGTIRFMGKGLSWAKKLEVGGLELSFDDHGSGEMVLDFSPENFKRLSEAVLRLNQLGEESVHFKDDPNSRDRQGTVAAECVFLNLESQAVIFGVDDPEPVDGGLPTIQIRPTSGVGSGHLDGFLLSLSIPQAEEFMKRLQLFLDAQRKHAEACKPKRIGRPAAAKRAGARASA